MLIGANIVGKKHGIQVKGATVNVTAGTIRGEKLHGIYFYNGANISVYGGTISGKQYGIYSDGGTYTQGGNPTITGEVGDKNV